MFKNYISKSLFVILLVSLILPTQLLFGQESSVLVIEDFESADFEDNWWSFEDGGSLVCDRAEPGFESDYALYISFELGIEEYAGCGRDILNAETWTNTTGLQMQWWASAPELEISLAVDMVDPTQTNPDAEGQTQFEFVFETPATVTDLWAKLVVPWREFTKAEWIGSSGTDVLDVSKVVSILVEINEAQSGGVWIDDIALISDGGEVPVANAGDFDKFLLWNNGTQLRGANIWQRIVVPELDGDEFLGSGHVGPPYSQDDFYWMASEGANYVNISHPGLFTENPPYVLDEAVQANLDNLLEMIAAADMFAVISFRTGPGRSDFTFYDDGIEEWGDPALVIEHVWVDETAQDAWVAMWHYTAERYRDNAVVAGYDLMVEPNAAGRSFDIYEPDEFYSEYANTLYDWNQLYPRLVAGIRAVDANTPILVSSMGWGAVRWLPYLEPIDDPRIVYVVHQYEPQEGYTHQEYPAEISYPGRLDLDWDGQPDEFGRDWLDGYLTAIDEFQAQYGVPVAVNEYGLNRWTPGAAEFMQDEMALFEERGMNHAFWIFPTSWQYYAEENDDFDYWHGADPNNHSNVQTSDMLLVIRENWGQNTVRPSTIMQN